MTEEETAYVAYCTCKALMVLTKHRIIHRDLKCQNILINSEGHCKIADFGAAAQLKYLFEKKNTIIGSPYWMAPEVIRNEPYSASADIWSLGITLIECLEQRPPLFEMSPMQAAYAIGSGKE